MPPLSLTDEELTLLQSLAEPIAFGRRDEFLTAVADELANCPQTGPGVTHRIAAEIQRRFVLQAQRVAPEGIVTGTCFYLLLLTLQRKPGQMIPIG
jgi:hypothetical protein